MGVHPVAVDLTLIQTRKDYTYREQYKTKYINKQGTHSANPNM
jgi:hypothetical protein